jgi:exodeoxyribonuclease V gamma subunit
MQVHRSNRTERLVEILGDVVSTPLPDPLARESIAVQGRGMERWLSMQLARRFGVWANPEFPFPRHLGQQQVRLVLGEDALDLAFEPEALRWSIAARLPPLLKGREFEAPRRYLEGDPSSFRLLQLAERLAALFDQYVVFRPEMILAWERGEEKHWQARLWRAVTQGRPAAHMAACARKFEAAVLRNDPPAGLPTRVSLFGLSTLAPLYLRILDQLSKWSEVHLFILSPSREFWAQIRSERDSLRRLPADVTGEGLEESLRRDAGNPLLASLGKLGREFQEVLESIEYIDSDVDR